MERFISGVNGLKSFLRLVFVSRLKITIGDRKDSPYHMLYKNDPICIGRRSASSMPSPFASTPLE